MARSSLATSYIPAYTGNYTKGRTKKITKITIHHMAGNLSAVNCGYWFQNVKAKGSSHYGIGPAGGIACYVDESNTAWTDGNWDSNCKSVTIECANSKTGGEWPVSDLTLNALIRLCADIARRNKLGKLVKGKNLTWHRMYNQTTCPGDYLISRMDYICKKANEINYPTTTKKTVTEIAKEVIAGKWGNGADRKKKLESAGYNYNEVQAKVNELLGTTSNAVYYTVQSGDTLSKIASKYGTTVKAIQKLNSLLIKNVNVIRVGWKIRVK